MCAPWPSYMHLLLAIVHACIIAVIYACTTARVHACTVAIMHACIMAQARAGGRRHYIWHVWRKSNSVLCWFSMEAYPLTTGGQICLCFRNPPENIESSGSQETRPACNLVIMAQAQACGRRRYVWHIWRKSNSVLCGFSIKAYPLTTGGQICLCFQISCEKMGYFGWQETKPACNLATRAQALAGGRRRYVWHVWRKSDGALCWFSMETYPLTTGGQICLCFRNPFENIESFGP